MDLSYKTHTKFDKCIYLPPVAYTHTMNRFTKYTWNLHSREFGIQSAKTMAKQLVPMDETGYGMMFAECLDDIKRKLDSVAYTKYIQVRCLSDPFETLAHQLQKEYGARNCTRGWLKMYEMLTVHELMNFSDKIHHTQKGGSRVLALFNCELPGGFLSAAHHYANTHGLNLEWWASSLDPTNEGALCDSFHLVQRYPERWLMDKAPHRNGDMTDIKSVNHLKTRLQSEVAKVTGNKHKVDLYVCDGGMDIKEEFEYQEAIHQALFLGELLTCLLTVRKGGNAVMKIYTFCTDFTRSLIACAACLFREAKLSKPLTSRPANTEIYLILKGYLGTSSEYVVELSKRLIDVRDSSQRKVASKALLNTSSPELAAFNMGCLRITDSLTDTIEMTIDKLVERVSKLNKKHEWINHRFGDMDQHEWISTLNVSTLTKAL